MRPSRYDRVCEIFWRACELEHHDRPSFLDQECGEDVDLRAEVDSMLAADEDSRFQQFTQIGEEMRSQVEAPPAQSPLRIGPFRIQGVLGEGGMGVVYLAEQERPRRTVALKVLQPNLVSERTLARFDHEAEILARLQHPGIARLYEVGTDQSGEQVRPWFAMERVEGIGLLEHAERHRLSLDQRLALFSTVCEAVHHAHLKGVIHRDLKPANVLVDGEGQAKVLDFGIARLSETGAETLALTGDFRQLVGTIPYMSPEQASGEFRDLDARSDVYSLGVILYELVSGRLPYPVRDTAILEAVRIVREQDPISLRAGPLHVDEDVDVIVRHALEKEKERRYQSASELAADLGRYLRREPIHARPPSTWYLVRRFAARRRALVTSVAALFLTLLTATVVSTILYQEARDANQGFQRLADGQLLEDLEQDTASLWPLREATLPAMLAWIGRTEEVLARLPEHRKQLAHMEESGQKVEETGAWVFADHTQRFFHHQQASLVQALERFEGPEGPVARIRQRMDTAARVRRATLSDAAAEWEAARASVASLERYQGLLLTPQEGLIPLRQDPCSGLWEFYLWESGLKPELDPQTGRWRVQPDTALVFVLLPPGTFLMGASSDPASPRHDPNAQDDFESPPHPVTLDAFFLSRYEVTQEQWAKVMGDRPSVYQDDPGRAVQPVESVSWTRAQEFCRRLVLTLPTEAQWEYACRADTDTPYYFGGDTSVMPRYENIGGQELQGALMNLDIELAPWDDGRPTPAPVGSLQPGPWGFQDILGNVAEWCRDGLLSYEGWEAGAGDGFRGTAEDRVYRGGDYYQSIVLSRCSLRAAASPEYTSNNIGLRPARPLLR